MPLLEPTTWTITEYLLAGGILSVVMLVLAYGIGLVWQRVKDRRKTAR